MLIPKGVGSIDGCDSKIKADAEAVSELPCVVLLPRPHFTSPDVVRSVADMEIASDIAEHISVPSPFKRQRAGTDSATASHRRKFVSLQKLDPSSKSTSAATPTAVVAQHAAALSEVGRQLCDVDQKASGMYRCKLCGFEHLGRKEFTNHLRGHVTVTTPRCDDLSCGFNGRSKACFRKHMYTHQHVAYSGDVYNGNWEAQYYCTVSGCGFGTSIKIQFENHLLTHFRDRQYQCTAPGCGFASQNLCSIECHLWSEHAVGKPYCCSAPGCNYNTVRQGDLKTHMQRRHGSMQKRFRCNLPGCGFATDCMGNLNAHMRVHTCRRTLLCRAPECGFTASSALSLKYHMQTHTVVHSKAVGGS